MPLHDLESTAVLLDRFRRGDASAREALLARYLPILRRWAHGRLPPAARKLSDTEDLVQITLIRVLNRLEQFEARHEGAFLAYLRQTMLNAMRREIGRTAGRRFEEAGPEIADAAPSPLEQAIGHDMLDRYESALLELTEEQREAVILRIEMGFSHGQIADALGKASPNAARMTVSRSLLRLAEAMNGSKR